MTGRRPSGNRIWTNTGALPSDIPTWAHALGAGGYDTALVGRMHFIGPDQRHGFMGRPVGEGCARFTGAPEQGDPRYTRLPPATAGQKRHAFEYAGRGNSFYQCNLVDLAPTFTDLAQAPAIDTDGASLLPMLRGETDSRRVTSSEVADVNGGHFEWVGKMVRRGPWKLWQHRTVDGEDYPPALFNLDNDPREQHNLAGREECRQVQHELTELLHEGWEPDCVIVHVRQELRDHKVLQAWGSTVQPPHPDTYPWPGEETEADLELL